MDEHNTVSLDKFDRRLREAKSEEEATVIQKQIVDAYIPVVERLAKAKTKHSGSNIDIPDPDQVAMINEAYMLLLDTIHNYKPGKGELESYLYSLTSYAFRRYQTEKYNRNKIIVQTDVTKVYSKIKYKKNQSEYTTVEKVKELILNEGIRKTHKFAEILANDYLIWREARIIQDSDYPYVETRIEYKDNELPEFSYLDIKRELNAIICKHSRESIVQIADQELEQEAQRLSWDYNELRYLKDRFIHESRSTELSNQEAFLLSMAVCGKVIDDLLCSRDNRREFEQYYRLCFDITDFSLDALGIPIFSPDSRELTAFKNRSNSIIRKYVSVPVFRNNYLSARTRITSGVMQSKLRSANIKNPFDFTERITFDYQLPFTGFDDAEINCMAELLQKSINAGVNERNTNTYLAMLMLFRILKGQEDTVLPVTDPAGNKIAVTRQNLLFYAERSFRADYASGAVDGVLGAMLYALVSELYSDGPVKSKLFLVKQILEQTKANGVAHDANSYTEQDLYDLYFAVSHACEEQRFSFSSYVEEFAMRYDITQVWDISPDAEMKTLVAADTKKGERETSGEAYDLYKESLLRLMENSGLCEGKATGSMLSFNLLLLDLAYPFRPLADIVRSCFRDSEFSSLFAYFKAQAGLYGITLENQDMVFLYCIKNETSYLRRLALSLLAHHAVKKDVISYYKKIFDSNAVQEEKR